MSSTTTKHLNNYLKNFYINNTKHTLGLVFHCNAVRNEIFTISGFLALWDLIGVRRPFGGLAQALVSINVVTLRWARLVPGWVTIFRRVNYLGM